MKPSEVEILANEFKKLSRGTVDYYKYTWYSITHHSTSIEGSTLTESQVINLLEYGKPAKNKPFDQHLMVTDHYKAMAFVMMQAQKKREISPEFIREIAAIVMKNTGAQVNSIAGVYNTAKGEFRKGTVRAGTRTFPDYKKVPDLIKNLCIKANKELKAAKTFEQKCNLAFNIHFEFVSIHPFGDGNGRTARLLTNYIQAYFGIPLSVVLKSDRISYINALESARKVENTEPFLGFMYRQYAKFLKLEIAEIK
ncbi:MAG: Fic family protein [Mariniphaga sp.]